MHTFFLLEDITVCIYSVLITEAPATARSVGLQFLLFLIKMSFSFGSRGFSQVWKLYLVEYKKLLIPISRPYNSVGTSPCSVHVFAWRYTLWRWVILYVGEHSKKILVMSEAALCSLVYRQHHFRATCCLHLQDIKTLRRRQQSTTKNDNIS